MRLLILAAISLRIAGAQVPSINPGGVVNAASYAHSISPGGIEALFGRDLSAVNGVVLADRFPLPFEIAGTSVTVNGFAASLLAVANVNGREQINFVTPPEIGAQSIATVTVTRNGGLSGSSTVAVTAAEPGVFTSDGVHAVVQHGAASGSCRLPSQSRRTKW